MYVSQFVIWREPNCTVQDSKECHPSTAINSIVSAISYVHVFLARSIFTGVPDFGLVRRCSVRERCLGLHVTRTYGIGEIQSPPGTSAKPKKPLCVKQESTVWASLPKVEIKLLTEWLLFCCTIALATLDSSRSNSEIDGIGKVNYKIVDNVHQYNLQDMEDLNTFASVFVSVLKKTME